MIIIKTKILRIIGAVMVSGFLYGTTTILKAQDEEVPVTSPVTPTTTVTPTVTPTVTVAPTITPTVTPTLTLTPTTTPSVTPLPKKEGLSTGGVQGKSGSDDVKLNFNARGGNRISGFVMYSIGKSKNFWGSADVCYNQSGSEAAFAGHVTRGNATQKYFLVKLQDNGEGKKGSADKFAVSLSDSEPSCTIGGYNVDVTKGNLQVH